MINYFDILEIPISYQINKDALLARYLNLQSRHHPDSVSPDNNMSELINHAYFVLNDDFSRMEHIIELNGIDLTASINDPTTINAIMDKSITLAEGDIQEREEALLEIKSEILHCIENCAKCISMGELKECSKYFMTAKCLKRLLSQNNV